MKLLACSLLLVAAACGGPKTKPSPIVPETTPVGDRCCCKSTPATSEDGSAVYESGVNRMECSTRQGTCESDEQCSATPVDSQPPSIAPSPN